MFIKFYEKYIFLIKLFVLSLCIINLILGIGFWLTNIEQSKINELRYCPHCGQMLLK